MFRFFQQSRNRLSLRVVAAQPLDDPLVNVAIPLQAFPQGPGQPGDVQLGTGVQDDVVQELRVDPEPGGPGLQRFFPLAGGVSPRGGAE